MSVVISGIKLLSLSPPTLLSLAQGGNAYTFCDSLLSWELPLSRPRLQPRPTGSDFPLPATERLGGSPRGCADMSEGLWPQIFLESKFKWVGRHCAPTRLRLTNWSVTLPGTYYLSTITWKYSFSFDIITWCEKRNIAPKIVVLSLPCSYLKSVDGSFQKLLDSFPGFKWQNPMHQFSKVSHSPTFLFTVSILASGGQLLMIHFLTMSNIGGALVLFLSCLVLITIFYPYAIPFYHQFATHCHSGLLPTSQC